MIGDVHLGACHDLGERYCPGLLDFLQGHQFCVLNESIIEVAKDDLSLHARMAFRSACGKKSGLAPSLFRSQDLGFLNEYVNSGQGIFPYWRGQ